MLPKKENKFKKTSETFIHFRALGEFKENIDFEIINTAKQTDSRYGDFQYTKKDLEEMAENFNNDVVGVDIAVDLNHDPNGIALAWIKPGSMEVKESSKISGEYSLFAKLHNFTDEGKKLVKSGAVKYFSIEIQHKFEKFVKKIKETYKNVIRGLALTNRPVIKDMMPTFSEKEIINNNRDMKTFKIYLSQLSEQEIVTLAERGTLKKMLNELSDEEKEEVKADVAEVEAKPEDEIVEKEEEVKEGDEDKEGNESKKAKEEENKELTETKEQLKKAGADAQKALSELKKRDVLDYIKSDMLFSEEKKELQAGITEKLSEKAVKFLMTLSEQQITDFKGIWAEVQSIDFSEHGLDEDGKKVDLNDTKEIKKEYGDKIPVDEDSIELDKKIKKYMSENKDASYDEAFSASI